ncbi:M4 family metallopeptidase [Sinorhizobium sp. BG8]|uniref:M4 family metallopeptidase n=1 Tax=Sinorhizobium sp. BG8 TaxID=2613773 RepID=UPI001FEE1E46|nr:M4 family metallopeptidase [Sinorhizobium sp. BG8]
MPKSVLLKLSEDDRLSKAVRDGLANTAKLDAETRKIREQALKLTRTSFAVSQGIATLAAAPSVLVYDCKNSQALPGTPISNPGSSADGTIKRAFDTTTAVAKFYKTLFGRNSIDNAGMTMQSSVHYGVNYNNAFWNGFQMTYGDGDGAIFVDFTQGDDVVCHELTHGVTQYSLQLAYANQAGGLNESASDVFGVMFNQWRASQTGGTTSWLIGGDIMGSQAKASGYTCLRDMADPGGNHCLAPQPVHYSDYAPGMDPHESSGIPNFAFYKIATAIGGNSWDKPGQIWYRTLTGSRPSPNMRMKTFANRTRKWAAKLYPGDAAVAQAVDDGWQQVGL